MILSRKLIVESPNYDLSYIKEAKNSDSVPRLYVEGIYMQHSVENKNKRRYIEDEMVNEVDRYIIDSVNTGSAVGELNHSQKPEIDLDRVCHRIVSLVPESNYFIGKSMVTTSTPKGKLMEGLIEDGVRIGMSTKALGQIDESDSSTNTVRNFMLIGVDAVHDPSCTTAFVNGILENKEFIINTSGRASEAAYEVFESALSKYPSQYRSQINEHVENAVLRFLNSL
jgi:hypothetical protein